MSDYVDDNPHPEPEEGVTSGRTYLGWSPRSISSHSTKPVEQWEGDYTFYRGEVVKIGSVQHTLDPDDVPGEAPMVVDIHRVPAIEPTPDEVKTFKAIWELADAFQARGLAKGSRVELALGIVLAMHEQPSTPPPYEIADIDSGATDEEIIARVTADEKANPRQIVIPASLDFSREDWILIMASLRGTARRTYEVHGKTETIGKLNMIANEVAVHLRLNGKEAIVNQELMEQIAAVSDPMSMDEVDNGE